MKQTNILILFLVICITLSAIPTHQEVGVNGALTSPFSPSSSEFDTIDSFNVHPLNRWGEATEQDWGSAVVSDGILILTDVGDGSQDYYQMDRDLKSTDGQIEIRFMYDMSDDQSSSFTSVNFYINKMSFNIVKCKDTLASETYLIYLDIDSDYETLQLVGDEVCYDDTWYRLIMDYDFLQSKFRWRLYYDENDSKILDYIWQDIKISDMPESFSDSEVEIEITVYSYSNNQEIQLNIDYVKAPFEERVWDNSEIPTDEDWLQNNWNFHEVQDDINDESTWDITIPYLDSVSATIVTEINNPSNLAGGEDTNIFYCVYAVDADDGEKHAAVKIEITQTYGLSSTISIQIDGVTKFLKSVLSNTDPEVIFSVSLENDRSRITVGGRYYVDRDDTTDPEYYDFVCSGDMADIATDPSQEFVLSCNVIADFDGDLVYRMMFTSHTIVERGEFSGKGSPLVPHDDTGSGGLFGWLVDIFITIGRAIGSLFAGVGIVIVEGLKKVGIDITGVIASIEGWLSSLGGAIEGFLITLGGLVSGVINTFISGARALLEALVAGAIILVQSFVDFLAAFVFLIWDAIGLPDLLAIADFFLIGFVQFIENFPVFLDDLINLIQSLWSLGFIIGVIYFLFFPLLAANTIGEFFEKFFENFSKDATMGASFVGVHIPIPIGLIWIVMLVYYVILGTIFEGLF